VSCDGEARLSANRSVAASERTIFGVATYPGSGPLIAIAKGAVAADAGVTALLSEHLGAGYANSVVVKVASAS
jgi:hypothetical protein